MLINTVIAQTNTTTVTCPSNTFLGTYNCANITAVPSQINTLESAMAPPYNIVIEGDIPPNLGATTFR